MIKILFFARLREQLSTDSLTIAARENLTTELIRQQLAETDDEVAFFPPVTGG